ncbi:MAG: outer membrane lipoprotein LolB [Casimicrobiaceae bacterium]
MNRLASARPRGASSTALPTGLRSAWSVARRLVPCIVVCVALLAGCAALSTAPATVNPVDDRHFVAEGRLSARHGTDAASASFRWNHAPPRDALDLTTPMGQIVAQFSGDADAHEARVQFADGRTMEAADFGTLTERALGFSLPVGGLAAWIRGGPHRATPFAAEVDDQGRVVLLRQDGWEIVFEYDEAATPARLRMNYPGVEVRVAVLRLD